LFALLGESLTMLERHQMKRVKPIKPLILTIRGSKILIDADLAGIYGVETRALNQAVKRNSRRFPKDFIFQLNAKEKLEVITNCDHLAPLKFAKSLPFAFTEHGALMAATVLNSPKAVAMSVYVVRAFIQMREQLAANRENSIGWWKLTRRYWNTTPSCGIFTGNCCRFCSHHPSHQNDASALGRLTNHDCFPFPTDRSLLTAECLFTIHHYHLPFCVPRHRLAQCLAPAISRIE